MVSNNSNADGERHKKLRNNILRRILNENEEDDSYSNSNNNNEESKDEFNYDSKNINI